METAQAIADSHGLKPSVRFDLGEMRFGLWEGKSFAELNSSDHWSRFNSFRSFVRPPDGELMVETQARMIAEVDRIRIEHKDEMVVVVSHGDPLRSLIAYYLGVPLDLMFRFTVSTASVTIVQVEADSASILCLNNQETLPQ